VTGSREAKRGAMREAELEAREAALVADFRRLSEVAATLKQRERALERQAAHLSRKEATLAREKPEPPKLEPAEDAARVSSPELMLEPPLRNVRTVLTRTMSFNVPVDGRLVWIRQVGGTTLVVGTENGQQIRITATRDPVTRKFASSYEATSRLFAEGSGSLVWETTSDYRPCESERLEGCLQSALEEVNAPGLPSLAAEDHAVDASAAQEVPAAEEVLEAIKLLGPGREEPRSEQEWLTTALSAIQRIRRLYPEVDQARSGPEWLKFARSALRRELPGPTS
jgi:hypothetical protein